MVVVVRVDVDAIDLVDVVVGLSKAIAVVDGVGPVHVLEVVVLFVVVLVVRRVELVLEDVVVVAETRAKHRMAIESI